MPRSVLRGCFLPWGGGGVSLLYSITRRLISRSNSRRLPAIVRTMEEIFGKELQGEVKCPLTISDFGRKVVRFCTTLAEICPN